MNLSTYNKKRTIRWEASLPVIFFYFVLCLGLTACTEHEGNTELPSSNALVTFGTYMDTYDPWQDASDKSRQRTRATVTGPIGSVEDLKDIGFGVMAYFTEKQYWSDVKTTAKPDFMLNQWVRWDTYTDPSTETTIKRWSYDPPKYWPNYSKNDITEARYISFFAYAPFTNETDIATNASETSSGIFGIPNTPSTDTDYSPHVSYRLGGIGNQLDLLWASCPNATRNGNGLIEIKRNEETGAEEKNYQDVPLTFHHALACLEIYVQRDYDNSTATPAPDEAEDTKIFISELVLTGTSTTSVGTEGKLNLEDGSWTITNGSPSVTYTYSGDNNDLNNWLSGTTKSDQTSVNNAELWKWGKRWNSDGTEDKDNSSSIITGVVETAQPLTTTGRELMLIPCDITLTPTLTYSFVTRDDALTQNYYTDDDDSRYQRVLNKATGNSVRLQLTGGKRYRLVCRIGVEHVSMEISSVEDWDFPLRFTPSVLDDINQIIPKTVNDEDE